MTATVSLSSRSSDEEPMSYLDRLRMRLHCHRLDLRLAEGEDPAGDPELRRRADELTSRRKRLRIAAVLDRVIAEAEGPAVPFESRSPLARGAICTCAAQVQSIVDRLESARPVAPRGVAQAALLIRDGSSPLYSPATTETALRDRLAAISDTLGE